MKPTNIDVADTEVAGVVPIKERGRRTGLLTRTKE